MENHACTDPHGRETLTVVRCFEVAPGKRQRFEATLVAGGIDRAGHVLDHLGTHQHLAVDLTASVLDDGNLQIVSGAQRSYEGRLGFRSPMIASGTALLREAWDEQHERFTIDVAATDPRSGRLAGCRGWFTCTYPEAVGDAVPASAHPLREELRR